MKRDGITVESQKGGSLVTIDERESFSKVRSRLERLITAEGVGDGERLNLDFGRRLLDSDQLKRIKKILDPVTGVIHIIHGQSEEILYKRPPQAQEPVSELVPSALTSATGPFKATPRPSAAAEVAATTVVTVRTEPSAPPVLPPTVPKPPIEPKPEAPPKVDVSTRSDGPAKAIATPRVETPAKSEPPTRPGERFDDAFPAGPGPLFTIQSGRARPRLAGEKAADLPPAPAEAGAPPPDDEAMVMRRTLRSGQVIHYPGHVTIIGDVNPGGEVIAGGDIIVLGVLRGIAHAGAGGNDLAVVAAFRLRPTQLRIGNHIARAPDGEAGAPETPELAKVRNGVVVIEPYHGLGE
ncbi:MAG TPA: septum site-determining protein MinC [Bacillota bacterium]|jgi:septum site-determining protein MinC